MDYHSDHWPGISAVRYRKSRPYCGSSLDVGKKATKHQGFSKNLCPHHYLDWIDLSVDSLGQYVHGGIVACDLFAADVHWQGSRQVSHDGLPSRDYGTYHSGISGSTGRN